MLSSALFPTRITLIFRWKNVESCSVGRERDCVRLISKQAPSLTCQRRRFNPTSDDPARCKRPSSHGSHFSLKPEPVLRLSQIAAVHSFDASLIVSRPVPVGLSPRTASLFSQRTTNSHHPTYTRRWSATTLLVRSLLSFQLTSIPRL